MVEPEFPIATRFLTDGGQTAADAAQVIVDFFAAASETLDLAIYDFRLESNAAESIVNAFQGAVRRGVQVRLVFNVDHAQHVDPPPPQIDWDLLHRLDIPFHPVSGVPDLMHHKYAVRDAGGASGAVLTGSTNWTTDSWTREENVFVSVRSPELAAAYTDNFEELWSTRDVASSGHVIAGWSTLLPGSERIPVRAHFCPGGAEDLVSEIATRLRAAAKRICLCSPVITDGTILGALLDVVHAGKVKIMGAYDATQMAEVHTQWSTNGEAGWKLDAVRDLMTAADLSGKVSTPYSKGSVHDFMHAKILVVDDCVFTGSYNLSHSGEANAENVLEVESAQLADTFAAYVGRVHDMYAAAQTQPLRTQ